ncbi:MAG: aminoacyl-histidine dipeptidase [Oscillospiraceae bacterium]|jgi:dipeptidase D|nr:aminoacyl-histidine dipeptidase [Oscillospiraceae bacterium]
MAVLEGLRPAAPLRYFEELCAIAHGSRDTKRISDYCVDFAKAHGLSYVQDEQNNVILYKNGSPGYEDHPTVILQGHLDMVCEKEADCDIVFSKDGLRLKHDGSYIYAEGTTLGADDGVAVAYALALLDSQTIAHPPLEVVLTTDEEIGMLGAAALDMRALKGRILLNIDSDEEGVLTVSCAGGATAQLRLPVERQAADAACWRILVHGLAGGHSGIDINKGRDNADKLMAELLAKLPQLCLISIDGGGKDNAIPRSCTALVCCAAPNFEEAVLRAGKQLQAQAKEAVEFSCEAIAQQPFSMTQRATDTAISLLRAVPNGVQAMSEEIAGLVQTSLNLGVLETSQEALTLTFSVRSSVNAEKAALTARLQEIAAAHGAQYSQSGDYPAWEYRKDSRLRAVMVESFEKLYGKTPVVEAIHAGLECGIFSDALPGLDAVSIGPNMLDIHTTRERLDIASTARTWDYLLDVLRRL